MHCSSMVVVEDVDVDLLLFALPSVWPLFWSSCWCLSCSISLSAVRNFTSALIRPVRSSCRHVCHCDSSASIEDEDDDDDGVPFFCQKYIVAADPNTRAAAEAICTHVSRLEDGLEVVVSAVLDVDMGM